MGNPEWPVSQHNCLTNLAHRGIRKETALCFRCLYLAFLRHRNEDPKVETNLSGDNTIIKPVTWLINTVRLLGKLVIPAILLQLLEAVAALISLVGSSNGLVQMPAVKLHLPAHKSQWQCPREKDMLASTGPNSWELLMLCALSPRGSLPHTSSKLQTLQSTWTEEGQVLSRPFLAGPGSQISCF